MDNLFWNIGNICGLTFNCYMSAIAERWKFADKLDARSRSRLVAVDELYRAWYSIFCSFCSLIFWQQCYNQSTTTKFAFGPKVAHSATQLDDWSAINVSSDTGRRSGAALINLLRQLNCRLFLVASIVIQKSLGLLASLWIVSSLYVGNAKLQLQAYEECWSYTSTVLRLEVAVALHYIVAVGLRESYWWSSFCE